MQLSGAASASRFPGIEIPLNKAIPLRYAALWGFETKSTGKVILDLFAGSSGARVEHMGRAVGVVSQVSALANEIVLRCLDFVRYRLGLLRIPLRGVYLGDY